MWLKVEPYQVPLSSFFCWDGLTRALLDGFAWPFGQSPCELAWEQASWAWLGGAIRTQHSKPHLESCKETLHRSFWRWPGISPNRRPS